MAAIDSIRVHHRCRKTFPSRNKVFKHSLLVAPNSFFAPNKRADEMKRFKKYYQDWRNDAAASTSTH